MLSRVFTSAAAPTRLLAAAARRAASRFTPAPTLVFTPVFTPAAAPASVGTRSALHFEGGSTRDRGVNVRTDSAPLPPETAPPTAPETDGFTAAPAPTLARVAPRDGRIDHGPSRAAHVRHHVAADISTHISPHRCPHRCAALPGNVASNGPRRPSAAANSHTPASATAQINATELHRATVGKLAAIDTAIATAAQRYRSNLNLNLLVMIATPHNADLFCKHADWRNDQLQLTCPKSRITSRKHAVLGQMWAKTHPQGGWRKARQFRQLFFSDPRLAELILPRPVLRLWATRTIRGFSGS